MGLRKGQKELVEQYRAGCCAVPAIPGGGKTHCLSMWACEIIAGGLHKPGKILIVTYMNSAVNNFRQRISRELQNRGAGGEKDYFISTIHGLCLQIVKERPDVINASDEFSVIDEVSKGNLIGSAVEEWRTKNEEKFRYFLEDTQAGGSQRDKLSRDWHYRFCSLVLTAVGDFKCRGMNPREAIHKCAGLPFDSLLKCAAEVYEIYDRRLKIGGFLDFDDMLFNAKKLLQEDEGLLEKYRRRYTFVCEDEAQDSNLIQSEILTMIANGNLLRVGDSNQAICGTFTSSDFKYFKEFCGLPQTTVYHITQSSRSTADVIDLANRFVRYVRERHPVEECRESLLPQYIEPVGPEDERPNPCIPEYGIRAGVFKSWDDEANAVVTQVRRMLEKHPDKTAAILVPTSTKMDLVVSMLENSGIPFEELGNSSGERNRMLKLLGRVIDFLSMPESSEKFAELMDGGLLSEPERERLIEFLRTTPVEGLLYPPEGTMDRTALPEELAGTEAWREFTAKREILKELLEYPIHPIEKLLFFIADKLDFDREQKAIVHKVAGDAGFMMRHDRRFGLSTLANELLSPRSVFSYFAGVIWDLKGYEPRPGVVTVSTYHKSKGLEWDVVFLTGLNNVDFPATLSDRFVGEYWFLKQDYKNPQAVVRAELQKTLSGPAGEDPLQASKLETISEKARLLYVGITRAREYLFLSGFHANPGKRNEVKPSQYLLELKEYIDGEVKTRAKYSTG